MAPRVVFVPKIPATLSASWPSGVVAVPWHWTRAVWNVPACVTVHVAPRSPTTFPPAATSALRNDSVSPGDSFSGPCLPTLVLGAASLNPKSDDSFSVRLSVLVV